MVFSKFSGKKFGKKIRKKFGKPHAVTGAIFNLLMKINFGVVKLQRIEEDLKIEVAFILFSKLESSFGRRNILTSVPI